MKKLALIFSIILLFTSFVFANPITAVEEYGLSLHEEATNENLKEIFSEKFKGFFNEVSGVWVTMDKNCNLHHLVEGKLDEDFNYQLFKINAEDAAMGTYSFWILKVMFSFHMPNIVLNILPKPNIYDPCVGCSGSVCGVWYRNGRVIYRCHSKQSIHVF